MAVGSHAAAGLEATSPSMTLRALSDMASLQTSGGLDLAPFTWQVSISADGAVIGRQPSPGTVGSVACYITAGHEQGAEIYASITLAPDAMRELMTASANGFVPIHICLEVRGASGEATPDGVTLIWDTDNEPEMEIAEARIFTRLDSLPSPAAGQKV
ncbi:hypothetical protein VDP36_06990 [Xanthomonas campestris pv. campestris]|nr:hypothetical protein [Xanthomonas campestris pv. campestris]MEB2041629.1 hypothetical protein [Xanthomonas campestris pv. campestris]